MLVGGFELLGLSCDFPNKFFWPPGVIPSLKQWGECNPVNRHMPDVCFQPFIQQKKLHNQSNTKLKLKRRFHYKPSRWPVETPENIPLSVWDSSWLSEANSETSLCVLKAFPGFWPLNISLKLYNWVTDAIFRQQYLKVIFKPDLTVLNALLNFIWQSSFGFRANMLRSFLEICINSLS